MCATFDLSPPDGTRAADYLAKEMREHLGVAVSAAQVRHWIETRSHIAFPLAHTIELAHQQAMVSSNLARLQADEPRARERI